MINLLMFLGVALASMNQVIEVQGHRGARGVRPENTLIGFKYAMENNIEVIELDLSYTKDHKLILSHDEKVNPKICLDPKGNKVTEDLFIHEMSLAEAQKFDCGSLINPRFPQQVPSPREKMPTFEEVLNLVKEKEALLKTKFKLNVEIKVHNDFIKQNTPKMVSEIIAAVKKHKLFDQTNIQSFDINVIDVARQQNAKIKTAFLVEDKFENVLKNLGQKTMADVVKKYKFNIFSPNYKLLTKKDVKDFQSQGIQVIPWTANELVDWKNLVEMEVDGIITDYPVALKDFLTKKSN